MFLRSTLMSRKSAIPKSSRHPSPVAMRRHVWGGMITPRERRRSIIRVAQGIEIVFVEIADCDRSAMPNQGRNPSELGIHVLDEENTEGAGRRIKLGQSRRRFPHVHFDEFHVADAVGLRPFARLRQHAWGGESMPVTLPRGSLSARARAALPVPVAMSMTRSSPRRFMVRAKYAALAGKKRSAGLS